MKKNERIAWNIFVSIFFTVLIAVFTFSIYKFTRDANPTEVYIFSTKSYIPGKPVSIILFAKNAAKKVPLKDQEISLSLNGKKIPSVKTKDDGAALLVLKKYPKQRFTLKASIGEHIAEQRINFSRTVQDEVKTLSKPVPKIALETDKPFYAPGETIHVTVKSKLPAKTPLVIESSLTFRLEEREPRNNGSMFGSVWLNEVRKQVPYKTIKTVTNTGGNFKFTLKLPEKFPKIDFDKEDSICRFLISAKLPDSKEKLQKQITISTRPVRIQAIWDFGKFIKGFPRNVYVFVGDPDKRPLKATVTLTGQRKETNKDGLALFKISDKITVETVHVDATVNSLGKATEQLGLRYNSNPEVFVIKTDKLIYNPGEMMHISVWSNSNQRIFLNISMRDKLLKTFSVEAADRKAGYKFKIPKDMSGLIQINGCRLVVSEALFQSNSQIIQVNRDNGRNCFSSPGQIIRARIGVPVVPEFSHASIPICNRFIKKSCTDYRSRSRVFEKEKDNYAIELFTILMPALFTAFIIIFIYFMRLYLYPKWHECILIVPESLLKKTRNNIFIAVPAYIILNIAFLLSSNFMPQAETCYSDSIVFIISGTIYVLTFSFMIWRSFHVRNLLLNVDSGKSGEIIKRSIFFIPYLFIIFVVFQQSWIVSLYFRKLPEWLPLLVIAFHGFALVWLILMLRIRAFYCTRKEYDSILQNKKENEGGIKFSTGLGGGIGAYPTSLRETWLVGGVLYWGVPILVYVVVTIIIIAMFLPLWRIIEKLG